MSKLVINVGDLTVGQTDEAMSLVSKGLAGETLALVYVFLKGQNAEATLDDAKAFRMKDIDIIDPDADENL